MAGLIIGVDVVLADVTAGTPPRCAGGLCATGRLGPPNWCCAPLCERCGGPGCGVGAPPNLCCPSRWDLGNTTTLCTSPEHTGCRLPPDATRACANNLGSVKQRSPKGQREDAGRGACRCYGRYSRGYLGDCLPSFMVIGSQKAATSKLRWYLSRHPSIDIPKEEAFHSGPNAVLAWDTRAEPTRLSAYLMAFEDVCNRSVISGLKMPDYIIMGRRSIANFHSINPMLRLIVTIREPIARLYSYFAMLLRLDWSPIGHMGKNPCMQRHLLQILEVRSSASGGIPARRLLAVPELDKRVALTPEEIMMANLACVRPCYPANASGLGDEGRMAVWHYEWLPECHNIHFTPLVHSMYALHLRRWLKAFDRSAFLLLRFDDLVARPLVTLQRTAQFLGIPPFDEGFKVEIGRENYTTVKRLLAEGTMSRESLVVLQDFFRPHDEQLHELWGESFW
mmetsp:Transcript_350/g.1109  ORF Transcript_350/g.1109 Transcript_350/m.1109 type:complete len:451 (-) Transcript_350:505-1857(-)